MTIYKSRSSVSLQQKWTSFVETQLTSSYFCKSICAALFFSPWCIWTRPDLLVLSLSQNNLFKPLPPVAGTGQNAYMGVWSLSSAWVLYGFVSDNHGGLTVMILTRHCMGTYTQADHSNWLFLADKLLPTSQCVLLSLPISTVTLSLLFVMILEKPCNGFYLLSLPLFVHVHEVKQTPFH